ncbi:MAG: NAD(P)H-binding protein [Pseudomonadota bacterium]
MTTPRKIVALFGATGTAGRATALSLLRSGHLVTAFGRRDPQIEGVNFRRTDVSSSFDLKRHDAVISCLTSRSGVAADAWAIDHAANLNVLAAAKAAGIPQFLLLSAICVQKPRLAFQHAKLAFEEALIGSSLTYTIIRPTAFYKSLSGQFDRLRAGRAFLMFGSGTHTACKPISDRDLGDFIARCLTQEACRDQILPIGGPGPALTPHAMGLALFKALGKTPKFKRIPLSIFTVIGGGLHLGSLVHSTLAQKAELARIGHYYASESMLLWDPIAQQYTASGTPETGEDRLFQHYEALAAKGMSVDRGEHAIF